jgi:hypothetical protein
MSHTYKLRYYTPTGYEDLDLGDEVPAMTYQINQLNELKDRNASYSQSIDLPKTRNNLRILGFPDCYDVVSPAAYDPQPCELELDGAIISPPGAMLYILSVGEEPGGVISTQIKADTFDLFSKLGEVDTENMNDKQWASTWDPHTIVSDNADVYSPRIWPLVCTIQGAKSFSPAKNSAGTALSIPILQTVPAYNFLQFITELLASFGYTIESDLTTDALAKSVYLTASNMTNDDGVNNSGSSEISTSMLGGVPADSVTSGQPETASWAPFIKTGSSSLIFAKYEIITDSINGDQFGAISYTAQQGGTYDVNITFSIRSGSISVDNGVLYIIQTIEGNAYPTDVESGNISLVAGGPAIKINTQVDLSPGSIIRIMAGRKLVASPATQIMVEAAVTISIDGENSNVGPGVSFNYPAAFGFSTYRDALQTFLQLFGAIIDVQRTASDGSGTARIYTYRHIYDNITSGNFVDWSDRLVMDEERTISFSMDGYGQRNIIEATENNDDGTQEQVSFSIGNKQLEGSKTLFTLATEAGRDISFRGLSNAQITTAVIPTVERDIETDDVGTITGVSFGYNGCAAHIVAPVNGATQRAQIESGGDPVTTTMPIVQTVPIVELYTEYYTPIVKMLRRQRPITVSLLLTVADIASFDPFKPVWIEHYGSYFYVSKISNFQAGQATAVDLIPM